MVKGAYAQTPKYGLLRPATIPDIAAERVGPDGYTHIGYVAFLISDVQPRFSERTERPYLLINLDRANFIEVAAGQPPRQVAVFIDEHKGTLTYQHSENAMRSLRTTIDAAILEEGRCGVIADLIMEQNRKGPKPAFRLSYTITDGDTRSFQIHERPYKEPLAFLERREAAAST